MPEFAVALCPYSTEEFLSAPNIAFTDEAVASVFSIMLNLFTEVISSPGLPPCEPLERTAIVGFSGAMRGSCELRMSAFAARAVTSAMLDDLPVEEGDESIDDAVGELCNMIAGGWKNRTPSLASQCSLSPPTVISGCDYKIHMNSASVKLVRLYRFDDHMLQLTLHCMESKADEHR